MDRGFIDGALLWWLNSEGIIFYIPAKSNMDVYKDALAFSFFTLPHPVHCSVDCISDASSSALTFLGKNELAARRAIARLKSLSRAGAVIAAILYEISSLALTALALHFMDIKAKMD